MSKKKAVPLSWWDEEMALLDGELDDRPISWGWRNLLGAYGQSSDVRSIGGSIKTDHLTHVQHRIARLANVVRNADGKRDKALKIAFSDGTQANSPHTDTVYLSPDAVTSKLQGSNDEELAIEGLAGQSLLLSAMKRTLSKEAWHNSELDPSEYADASRTIWRALETAVARKEVLVGQNWPGAAEYFKRHAQQSCASKEQLQQVLDTLKPSVDIAAAALAWNIQFPANQVKVPAHYKQALEAGEQILNASIPRKQRYEFCAEAAKAMKEALAAAMAPPPPPPPPEPEPEPEKQPEPEKGESQSEPEQEQPEPEAEAEQPEPEKGEAEPEPEDKPEPETEPEANEGAGEPEDKEADKEEAEPEGDAEPEGEPEADAEGEPEAGEPKPGEGEGQEAESEPGEGEPQGEAEAEGQPGDQAGESTDKAGQPGSGDGDGYAEKLQELQQLQQLPEGPPPDVTDKALFGEVVEGTVDKAELPKPVDVKEAAEDPGDKIVQPIDCPVCDSIQVKFVTEKDPSSYRAAVMRMRPQIAALQLALRFRNNDLSAWNRGCTSGDLDEGSLDKLSLNESNPAIWERRELKGQPKIAIGLLLDQSGSMNSGCGTKIKHARDVCTAMAEAMSRIRGVALMIIGHQGDQTLHGEAVRQFKETGRHHDHQLAIEEFYTKQHKNPWAIAEASARGYTYDSFAMEYALQKMLVDYPEYERRALFLISDGTPCGSGLTEAGEHASYRGEPAEKHMRQMCEYGRRHKINVYGIGICNAYDSTFGDNTYGHGNYVVLNDVTSSLTILTAFLRQIAAKQ